MESFENVYNTICRVCLTHGNRENVVSLLDKTSTDGISSYGKAAQIFANIFIANDFLPSVMCKNCLNLLTQAVVFKNTCEQSQIRIEKLLSIVEFSEQEFQEKLVEYVLYTSIFPEDTRKNNSTNRSALQKNSKCNKKQKKSYEAVDPSEDFYSTFQSKAKTTENKPGSQNLSSNVDSQDANHLFNDSRPEVDSPNDNFQNYDSDSDDQSNDQSIVNTKSVKNADLKQNKESNVFETTAAVSNEENYDQLLDAIEDVIQMDNTTFKLLTHHKKKEKSTKKAGIKSENLKNTEQNICQYCNKSYSSKWSLKLHIERHTGLYGFVCEHCAQRYPTKSELEFHLNSRHDAGTKFVCDECGYQAYRKYELQEHIRIHTGEKPYKCEKCGMRFRQQFVFKRHMIYHTDKTVQCLKCPKKFHTNHDMTVHMNGVHDRRYLYGCDFCDIKYAKISTVRRHITEQHNIPRSAQGKITKISLDSKKVPKRRNRRKGVRPPHTTCDDEDTEKNTNSKIEHLTTD